MLLFRVSRQDVALMDVVEMRVVGVRKEESWTMEIEFCDILCYLQVGGGSPCPHLRERRPTNKSAGCSLRFQWR